MKLVFDAKAVLDIEAIYHWISQDSPAIAGSVIERLFVNIERLVSFPQIGRLGQEPGAREWVVPRLPYIVD